jgi:methyl-accepting chemotaxis protein
MDQTIVNQLEGHLRILQILPRVRLEPGWLASTDDKDESAGLRLPIWTKLVLPARDWNTGAPRWVVYRASAFLPPGREMWSVLGAMILLLLLPLALSIWGAYFTYQRTVRPLTRLLTGIKRVETGDLDYRLGETGRTEIATAARAFDRMAESLEKNVRELAEKKKVEEVSELKSYFISMVSHDL